MQQAAMRSSLISDTSKPLLKDSGTSDDAEGGRGGDKGKACMPPVTSKLDLLESFDSGSISGLQSDLQTILNTVNLYVGVGLLSLGYAFRLGGWMSLAVLGALSIIFAYSAKLICWSFDKMPTGVLPSYPNLGTTALGTPGHWMVMLMGVAEFFGASCLCLIVVWQSIEMLLPAGPFCLGSTCVPSREMVVIGSIVIMLPAIWIRTFSRLTSISISGILSSLLLTSVVVIAFVMDPEREAVDNPASAVHEIVDWAHLPIATGILVVSLSGHAGLPSLRRSMRNPHHFEHCVNLAFFAMFLLYATMAGCAYFYFGQATQVLVTANLNQASGVTGFVLLKLGRFSLTINQVVTALVALSAYSTIPALLYVVAELIVDMARRTSSPHAPGIMDLIARTIVLVLAYVVAYFAYDVLDSVESLVGGVCSVSVSLLLPSLFYYKLHEQDLSLGEKAVVISMCGLGILCVLVIAFINILELSHVIKV